MYTNGFNLRGDYMKRIVDEGIDFIRCSVIGYDQSTYMKWMDCDNFYRVRANLMDVMDYSFVTKAPVEVSSYHLITDNNKIKYEVSEYNGNFIRHIGCKAYIWKMHNWSGNYDPNGNARIGEVRKTCGRPFGP